MSGITEFNSAIGWVKNYTKIFRGYLVKLRVTNRYAQKKKDSVQAVLIQLHSVEQATNYPNYIGLVKYFQSSIGGWDLMSVRNTYAVQPFGSMPNRSNSFRPRVLSQLAKLMFDSFAAASNCSFNSGVMRILNCGDCPSPLGLLSRFTVDKWSPIELISIYIGGHLNTVKPIKSTPPNNATNTIRGLITNDRVIIEVTMSKHITPVTGRNSFTPNTKFLWRFFSCQQSKYFSVEANNEQEARSLLPDSPCLFSARIRQGVNRA